MVFSSLPVQALRRLSALHRQTATASSQSAAASCVLRHQSTAAVNSISAEGKVVLVTGGGDGIGSAMVRTFAAAGASVVYTDLNPQSEVVPGAAFIECDVRDRSLIHETVAAVIEQHGHIDVLCNNVGVVLEAGTPLHETSDDAWDHTMAVNLTSYFQFSKAVIPHMLKKGSGCIIQTSSVQGLQSMPGVCSYAASKGAISSLTRNMAVEYATQGIRVNSICPGSIATPMNVKFQEDEGRTMKEAAVSIPMRRVGEMDEIANTALFLASDAASYITGQDLVVDGGLMAMGQWAN